MIGLLRKELYGLNSLYQKQLPQMDLFPPWAGADSRAARLLQMPPPRGDAA